VALLRIWKQLVVPGRLKKKEEASASINSGKVTGKVN
jgi:hypothetical protein